MKKLLKGFCAFCLMFIMSFSLVACSSDDKGKNNGGDKPQNPAVTDKYTPPEGVDMTDAEAYGTWLKNNADIKLSYEMKIVDDLSSSSMKYVYDDKENLIYLAHYDESETIISYKEIELIGKSSVMDDYDVKTIEKEKFSYTQDEYLSFKSENYFSDIIADLFLNGPESEYEDGMPDSVNVDRSISEISEGKYLLKTSIMDLEEHKSTICEYTYEKDRVSEIKIVIDETINEENLVRTKFISYEYEDEKKIEIKFNKKTPSEEIKFYQPPEGVNMKSAEAYAEWLDVNRDVTQSYEVIANLGKEEINMKYVYKDDIVHLAFYDENGNITKYEEWEYSEDKSTGEKKVLIRTYDIVNKTYKEVEEIDNDNSVFLERVKQQYYADTMAYLFLNFYELNYKDGVLPKEKKVKREIAKISNGIYDLKVTITDTKTKKSEYMKFTYKNDKIVSYGSGNSLIFNTVATFNYENVSIVFDTTGYTEVS